MVDAEISCGGFRPQWIGRDGIILSCFSNFPRLAEMCNLQQPAATSLLGKADRVICVYGHAYKPPATTVADYSFTTGERANKS